MSIRERESRSQTRVQRDALCGQPRCAGADGALSNVCPDGYKEIKAGETAECEKAAADSNVNAKWHAGFSPSTSELPTGCYKNTNNGNAHINAYAGVAYDTFDDSKYDGGGLMHKICKANSGSSCEQCGDICTRKPNGHRGGRHFRISIPAK